mmetsp:Transcript_4754/g.10636  ORF Transcript_4754/g.10636 Transcript_4754/m.10636 type:complete len:563 (-) Transcript_4754:31-1719(-)
MYPTVALFTVVIARAFFFLFLLVHGMQPWFSFSPKRDCCTAAVVLDCHRLRHDFLEFSSRKSFLEGLPAGFVLFLFALADVRFFQTDDGVLDRVHVVLVDLPLEVLAVDKGGQVVLGSLQFPCLGVGLVVLGSEALDVIESLALLEVQTEGIGDTFDHQYLGDRVLVGGVVGEADDLRAVGTGHGGHIFDAPAHGLQAVDLRIVRERFDVPALVHVIVQTDVEEVVPPSARVGVEARLVGAPGKPVAVEVVLGFVSGIRKDLAVFFGPTQIRVVAGVLLRAVSKVAVSVLVEVLTVAGPATDGRVGGLAAALKSGGGSRQELVLGLVFVEIQDGPTGLVGSLGGRIVFVFSGIFSDDQESFVSTLLDEFGFLLLEIARFEVQETLSIEKVVERNPGRSVRENIPVVGSGRVRSIFECRVAQVLEGLPGGIAVASAGQSLQIAVKAPPAFASPRCALGFIEGVLQLAKEAACRAFLRAQLHLQQLTVVVASGGRFFFLGGNKNGSTSTKSSTNTRRRSEVGSDCGDSEHHGDKECCIVCEICAVDGSWCFWWDWLFFGWRFLR